MDWTPIITETWPPPGGRVDPAEAWWSFMLFATIDLCYGVIVFFVARKHYSRRRGCSPIPSPMPFAYVVFVFLSQPSQVLGQSGYGIGRLIESLLLGFVALCLSFSINFGIPTWLAAKMTRSSWRKTEDNGANP